jgi:FkbM family methyltransferase
MKQDSLLARFNRRVPFPLRLLLVALVGISLLPLVQGAQLYGSLLYLGLKDPGRQCSLWQVMRSHDQNRGFYQLVKRLTGESRVIERDEKLGLVRVAAGGRTFWAQEKGDGMPATRLIPYLEGEQRWMHERNPEESVRPGDTVVDCGAHIGIFTMHALERGAGRVVAIEPDATNLECLRRNLADGIASGRVIVVPKAVWNEETTLKFTVSDSSSARHSAIIHTGTKVVDVPATTLDAIMREHGIERVDYLKLDIEGAERQALEGGMGTLTRHRPRVLLESYHLPDDPVVLPRLLRSAYPGYREICGPCEWSNINSQWTPHVLYFR